MKEIFSPEEREIRFERFIITEYLKYGSVDELFKAHDYELPISYPGVHRLLDKWGIVKAAGPNTRLSEALCFLSLLSSERIPLERLYRDMPPSFKTSMCTLHRILSCIRKKTIRRVGTALVLTPKESPNLILVGNDVSIPRLEVGKPFGSLSLPMGYSKRTENAEISILRVMQQEVFTREAVERSLDFEGLIKNPKPFMYLDIADVRVGVYHFALPENLAEGRFSSFKLSNHRYLHLSEIVSATQKMNFRAGIKEIGLGYQDHLLKRHSGVLSVKPILETAFLNKELAIAYAYLEKLGV